MRKAESIVFSEEMRIKCVEATVDPLQSISLNGDEKNRKTIQKIDFLSQIQQEPNAPKNEMAGTYPFKQYIFDRTDQRSIHCSPLIGNPVKGGFTAHKYGLKIANQAKTRRDQLSNGD